MFRQILSSVNKLSYRIEELKNEISTLKKFVNGGSGIGIPSDNYQSMIYWNENTQTLTFRIIPTIIDRDDDLVVIPVITLIEGGLSRGEVVKPITFNGSTLPFNTTIKNIVYDLPEGAMTNITSLEDMFSDLGHGVSSINIASIDTTNVSSMSRMFTNNSRLSSIIIGSGFVLNASPNIDGMFGGIAYDLTPTSQFALTGPTDTINAFISGIDTPRNFGISNIGESSESGNNTTYTLTSSEK